METVSTNGHSPLESQNGIHPLLQATARFISYVFHPLFLPIYLSWFLMYNTPLFTGLDARDKLFLLIRFFVMYTVFPLVTILLAKGLGFVQSIHLHTQKDRIIPYIACGLYYFWMWYVLRNQPQFPQELVMLSLSIFIASSLGLMLNSYLKISMHGISLGVMVAFVCIVAFLASINFGAYISIALLVAGVVSTARLINSDHHPVEVYAGLAAGIIGGLAAYWFVY
ncbi:MAG: hypothetical protein WKF70_07600 [Chitinophagaceae bacterium]